MRVLDCCLRFGPLDPWPRSYLGVSVVSQGVDREGQAYHQATKAAAIGVVAFLLKGLGVVVRNPLIAVPIDPLDRSGFVVLRCQGVLGDDVLNLLIVEDAGGVGTRPRIGTAAKFTDAVGDIARRVFQSKASAILKHIGQSRTVLWMKQAWLVDRAEGKRAATHPALTQDHFVGGNAGTPKKIEPKINFGNIGVRGDVWANKL